MPAFTICHDDPSHLHPPSPQLCCSCAFQPPHLCCFTCNIRTACVRAVMFTGVAKPAMPALHACHSSLNHLHVPRRSSGRHCGVVVLPLPLLARGAACQCPRLTRRAQSPPLPCVTPRARAMQPPLSTGTSGPCERILLAPCRVGTCSRVARAFASILQHRVDRIWRWL